MSIVDQIVEWWLKRCPHKPEHVTADLLEGEFDVAVKYCRRCGAVRPNGSWEWRRPRPLWFQS